MNQLPYTPFNWTLFNACPVVGIIRGFTRDQIRNIISSYHEAGLNTVEITMNTEGATEMMQWANEEFGDALNIGAGTVCSDEDLLAARQAGASFIVTPYVEEGIITTCKKAEIPIFPGAFSPTEIYKAWKLGGSIIKVFPSAQFGPGYLKAIHGPFPQIPLLPTGGIHLGNISEYLQAGASGLGMGGGLFPKDLIQGAQWDQLTNHFSQIVEKVRSEE